MAPVKGLGVLRPSWLAIHCVTYVEFTQHMLYLCTIREVYTAMNQVFLLSITNVFPTC